MNKQLNRIAVDLTPVLPGGENGGAKIFVLELLRRLAEIFADTEFILLTQAAAHEELAALDRSNIRRQMVVGPLVANGVRPRLVGFVSQMLPHLPVRLRSVVLRVSYTMNTALKRAGSGSLLREMGADLLFCPFTAPTYFELGIPTVCTIYDLQYKTYPEFFSAEDVAHREQTFVDACRRATLLAAISDYSRESAIMHGQLDPARIRTIHLRMGHRILPEGSSGNRTVLNQLGVSPQRYLLYPANFWKHKNHEMLLTAFAIACNEGLPVDIKLVCTGAAGERQEWLRSAASIMNLGDRVSFPGYLSNKELADVLANCAGVVFPSLYEGFGLPVIEAMAVGIPVACSNTTSLPEVAANAAILFDPRVPVQIAQAVLSLVADNALRVRLIKEGLQRASEFSNTERMAREYWELFRCALANHKREDILTGVYSDGWVSSRMLLQVATGKNKGIVELELETPDWTPQSFLTVTTKENGKIKTSPVILRRGMRSTLSICFDSNGGNYEICIAPTFVPAQLGLGIDQRELSAVLRRCGISRGDGYCVTLIPEKAEQ